MKKFFQSKNGFTGVEISVALVILMIFISLISTIFINIYLSFSDAQRNSAATGYATQLAETIDRIYYAEVNNETLASIIEEMNIPSGYKVVAEVNNFVPEEGAKDLVKTIIIKVEYKIGNNTKSIQIEKIKSKEVLITPNKPKLSNGMVPVKYVTTDEMSGQGYWEITTENDSTWYNYDNKRWANIMLQDGLTVEGDIQVTDENRKSLEGKKVTTLGSMFVWIPRYAYKIPEENLHTSTAGEIDIVFLYSTSDNYVDENGDMKPISNMGGYKIHPSFQNGEENDYANGGWDTELTGYWVAKFEASSSNPSATDGGGDTTELEIKVLPNVPSWRSITLNNMFSLCQNMNSNENIYNLSNNVEPHMMKNTEWGAVAYLSQSKYGLNAQVWNNPYYVTGKVASRTGPDASQTTECDEYNQGNGPKGSTSGNVYGIYDMAGGGGEYVAAIVDNNYSKENTYITKVYQNKETKYVDRYSTTQNDNPPSNYETNSNKYGDAMYETSQSFGNTSWYNDTSFFPYSMQGLFIRGDAFINSVSTGVFCFYSGNGSVNSYNTFRPVITIP